MLGETEGMPPKDRRGREGRSVIGGLGGGVMPKRKLSDEKRLELRSSIRGRLAAGVPKAEILRSMSQQYGVTDEAIRWYYNSIAAESGAGGSRRAQSSPAQNSIVGPHGLRSLSGSRGRLLVRVKRLKKEYATQAKRVERLFVEWESHQCRVLELLQELKKEEARAKRVQERIAQFGS
jgi:hypothetical protein